MKKKNKVVRGKGGEDMKESTEEGRKCDNENWRDDDGNKNENRLCTLMHWVGKV
jgi:hypothetical protein